MSANSEDIFQASARYYTEFRKPYPPLLWRRIRDRFQLDGEGDLLDVGCGTGQVALPLSKWFRRVVGVDLSEAMVSFARQNAIDQQIENVDFHALSGEDVSQLSGEFNLVTYGSALHWMDIPRTLAASNSLLAPGGGVAILGMRSIWGGESDWEQTVVRVVQRWMGQDRRAGTRTFETSVQLDLSFERALNDAGFVIFDSNDIEANYTVDVPFILGHLYTTSYCNRELLGDDADGFEKELGEALLKLGTNGTFVWSPGASYIFSKKRN